MNKWKVILTGCVLGMLALSCSSPGGGGAKQFESDKPVSIAMTGYAEQYPVFSVAEKVLDFGTIHQGDVVRLVFRFKNTGTKPLIISQANSTCGCTVPDYPKSPVAPGEEGELKVVFNSADKMGMQMKPIFISANTMPSDFRLTITGNVVEKGRPVIKGGSGG